MSGGAGVSLKTWVVTGVTWGVMALSVTARAEPVPPAYFDAASRHQVPPEVLYAVATTEIGRAHV